MLKRTVIALLALLLLGQPVAAAEISSSSWSETDASNSASPPNGFPEGQAPSSVNDSARQVMGAVKRFWDRINPTITSTGSANAYTYTPTNASFPASLVTGECFSWKANFTNTGAATLAVNGLTAKNIFKQTSAGPAALASGDIQSGQLALTCYDGTQFQLMGPASNAITGGGAGLSGAGNVQQLVNAQTGTTYTVVSGDQAKLVTFANASAIAVTLPQATGSFAAGWFADLTTLASSTGTATITPTTSTIDGATTLQLPPGTSVRIVSDGTNYQIQRGIGRIAQIQLKRSVAFGAEKGSTGSTVMALDDNPKTNSDGDQYLSQAITPTNSSSTLIIEVNVPASVVGATSIVMGLFQDSTTNALASTAFDAPSGGAIYPITLVHSMTAGTTSATTFKVRIGPGAAATISVNGASGSRKLGGGMGATLKITEILP